jgi:type I restriction enzyme M protein
MARDKASLDIFWLRDESLEDTANLPSPGLIAAEIVEDVEAALAELQRSPPPSVRPKSKKSPSEN